MCPDLKTYRDSNVILYTYITCTILAKDESETMFLKNKYSYLVVQRLESGGDAWCGRRSFHGVQ